MPWANLVELCIGLLKSSVGKDMKSSNCPICLWNYCIKRRAHINNMTLRDNFKLQRSNPYTIVVGDQGDISNLYQFDWYE